jgi:hypothetical protein
MKIFNVQPNDKVFIINYKESDNNINTLGFLEEVSNTDCMLVFSTKEIANDYINWFVINGIVDDYTELQLNDFRIVEYTCYLLMIHLINSDLSLALDMKEDDKEYLLCIPLKAEEFLVQVHSIFITKENKDSLIEQNSKRRK